MKEKYFALGLLLCLGAIKIFSADAHRVGHCRQRRGLESEEVKIPASDSDKPSEAAATEEKKKAKEEKQGPAAFNPHRIGGWGGW